MPSNSAPPDYSRMAGVVELFPHTALSWFGYGSRESVEMYDLVLESGEYGQSTFDAAVDRQTGFAKPDMIFVKDKYLALLPTADEEDTLLIEWATDNGLGFKDNGKWKELRTNSPTRRKRLVQVDSSPIKTFNRKSTFPHTMNASFAIRMDINTPSAKGSEADGTRFAAITWGDDSWAIFFFGKRQPILAEAVGGSWVPRQELPNVTNGPGQNLTGETVYIIEHIRNSIIVTVDFSVDQILPPPDATSVQLELTNKDPQQAFYSRDDFSPLPPVGWKSGKFRIYGYGLQVALGLSRVSYPNQGTWFSGRAPMRQDRPDQATMIAWGNANQGTVTLVQLTGAGQLFFQYKAIFTPGKHTIGSKTWYTTPDLESVAVWYPAVTVPPWPSNGDFGQTLEGKILSATVNKPEETDQAEATIKLFFEGNFFSVTGAWRMRPMRLWLGWELCNTRETRLVNVFTGHLSSMTAEQVQPGQYEVTMNAVPISIRAKKHRFGPSTAPRGGMTLNAILTIWMQSIGIVPNQYRWHPFGDYIVLPRGRPEDPSFRPEPESDSWQWHEELCNLHGLQLVISDEGLIGTFPIGALVLNPVVFIADNPENVNQALFKSTLREEIVDNFTRYILHCKIPKNKDGLGRTDRDSMASTYSAWAINYSAEQTPNYIGFSNIQMKKEESLDFGPTSPGFVNMCVYYTAERYIIPRQYHDFEGEFSPFIGRKHTVRIFGGGMQEQGIYIVESVQHEVEGENFQGKTRISAYRTLY